MGAAAAGGGGEGWGQPGAVRARGMMEQPGRGGGAWSVELGAWSLERRFSGRPAGGGSCWLLGHGGGAPLLRRARGELETTGTDLEAGEGEKRPGRPPIRGIWRTGVI